MTGMSIFAVTMLIECALAIALTVMNPKWHTRAERYADVVVLAILALVMVLLFAASAEGATHRDPAQRRAFVHSHPCPATGKTSGRCPGYVVDHVMPLCKGGSDRPFNMQWSTKSAAKAKDKWECK